MWECEIYMGKSQVLKNGLWLLVSWAQATSLGVVPIHTLDAERKVYQAELEKNMSDSNSISSIFTSIETLRNLT